MRIYSLLVVAVIAFTACQKEITLTDDQNTGGTNTGTGNANAGGVTGGTNGTVIMRAVRKVNNDSVVVNFTYDSNDRMLSYSALGKEKYDTFNINYNIQYFYKRDAAGRVISYTSPNTLDTSFFGQLDSIRTKVYYPNATSTEFSAIVSKAEMGFLTNTDSTVYTFNNGKVVQSVTYTSNDLFGTTPIVAGKSEFTYDAAGNVKERKQYTQGQTSTALSLALVETNTFDTKPNAQEFKNEGFFFGSIYQGPNNIIKSVHNNHRTNQVTSITAAYNYNANNRPQNGQIVYGPPLRSFTLTYYYR